MTGTSTSALPVRGIPGSVRMESPAGMTSQSRCSEVIQATASEVLGGARRDDSCVIQTVTRSEETLRAVTNWLLSAARDPLRAVQEWDMDGMTVVQCGALFCAIRLPVLLVEAIASPRSVPVMVDAFLAEVLEGGPVIRCNTGRFFYALVEPSAADRWHVRGTECLGRGYDLGVPSLDLTEHPGYTASYWAVPVREPGVLCEVVAVEQFLLHGRHLLALEEEQPDV